MKIISGQKANDSGEEILNGEKMKNQIKYAVVFAGQGAQKPGMGKSLYEISPAARAVFDRAGEEIKYDCFEADAERLRQTEVTQPAVYTMDMAAFAALMESLWVDEGKFPEPSAVAGFSLGEYAAFTASGAIDSLAKGLDLVKIRSLLMKEAGTNPDGSRRGAMAAGMGEKDAVLALVDKARGENILEAVNFNSPQQTVVAGEVVAVERFAGLAADRSFGVKAIPLSVSGAFHSPLMRQAAEGLSEALKEFSFGEPKYTVYLNSTGGTYEEYRTEEKAKEAAADANSVIKSIMVRQIQNPVEWLKTTQAMKEAGIETVIEVGPGKTLTGLVKKTAPDITALHVEDKESLEETVSRLKSLTVDK